jgi:tetratricopeptide (TPR) repeat protein
MDTPNHPTLKLFGIIAIFLAPGIAHAADVSDLGVPKGWRAMDYDKRGHELLNKHQYELARRYLTAAIRLEPDRWSAYYNRAETYFQQKNWPAALEDLNATIRLKPSFLQATFKRARTNEHLHNYRAAMRDLDVVAGVAKEVWNSYEYAVALNNRAWLYATCPDESLRNVQLAIADAKKACELLKWKGAPHIDTLAAAYAEAGDFDSAIKYQEQAIQVHEKEPDEMAKTVAKAHINKILAQKWVADAADQLKKSAPDYAKRLDLYQQHRPYRQAEPPEY